MKPAPLRAGLTLAIAAVSTVVSAQPVMTEAEARAVIAPLYTTFTQPVRGDVRTLLERGTTENWQSCAGDARPIAAATMCRSRSSRASAKPSPT